MVQVRGVVRKMNAAEIEREIGWDIETAIETAWRDRAVVIADDIAALDPVARWSEKDDPRGMVISLWTIYEAPSPMDYVDADISLERVEVADKSDRGLFVGFNGAPDIFVAKADGAELGPIKEGQHVAVTGTIKSVPRDTSALAAFKLSREQSDRLSNDELYIEASAITTITEKEKKTDQTASK